MHKYLLIICCCFLSVTAVYAQTVFSGRVLENKTRITLRGVHIENLNNKLKSITDNDGHFSIGAKVGDLIVFKNFSYQPDTLLLTTMFDREIFLEPQKNMLNQVTITDSSGRSVANKNAIPGYDPQFHGQTVVYQRDDDLNYKGGVAIRMHYWDKDERKKRKEAKSAKDQQTSEEISKLFVADKIEKYVPLKGDEMDNFILTYTPTVKMYTNSSFNLLNYLSACYKEWQTLTPAQKQEARIFDKE